MNRDPQWSSGQNSTMPKSLEATVDRYERDARTTIYANWAAITESERQEYRNFVSHGLWPHRRRRCKIAAARLAQSDPLGS